MPRKLGIDWNAAQSVFVCDSTLSYKAIAERFGCAEVTVRSRACRERWPEARARRAGELLAQATRDSISLAAQELARYNEQDLLLAKALRGAAARHLQSKNLSCSQIRAVAAVVESAQRVARLALGATTGNTILGTSPVFTSELDDLDLGALTDDELGAFKRLVAKSTRRKPSGGEKIQ